MSSDSERSFEKFDPDFAMSERSESVSTLTSSAEDTLRIENERLRMENSLLRMEMMDRLPGSQLSNASHLQSQIGGSWKVVSSSNVDEYLSKRGASEVSDIVFQVGDVHFEFDDTHHKMRVFNQIGHKQYGEKWFEWGRPQWEGSVSFSTYFTEHCMKTVYAGRGGEEDVEEVSVSDGRLHFVIRRWGVQCERVYRRSGEVCEEKVKELEDRLEKANSEIEELKLENADMMNQLEKANSEIKELKLDVEALNNSVKNSEEMMKRKEVQLENANSEIEELMLENAELAEFKKKAEEVDIKKTIVGLWKQIDGGSQWSFKVEGNQLMERWYGWEEYKVYTFGVKHPKGWTVTVEGGRIVERRVDERWEWYMENDQLIRKCYYKDKFQCEHRFKKIGPPS